MTDSVEDLEIQIDDKFVICYIRKFSDLLKNLIRNHLSNICHGKSLASEGLTSHSYNNTLVQFRNRYTNKTDETKKGIMGELLSHVLIHEYFDDFDVISPFFNMEEKSQRKGFDLLLISKADEELWITEVKSGEVGQKGCPDAATKEFLHTAKRDLKLRLNQPEETFWLNAINTANNVISDCNDYKKAVLKILDGEGVLALNDKADSKDNNVILISVLFHNKDGMFDSISTERVSKKIEEEGVFKRVLSFSIQKETYQMIEKFIFEEEIDGQ